MNKLYRYRIWSPTSRSSAIPSAMIGVAGLDEPRLLLEIQCPAVRSAWCDRCLRAAANHLQVSALI